MKDLGHEYTDEQIKDLERRIHAVYSEAQRDLEKKIDEFNKKFVIKDSIHMQQVKDGTWTQERYDNWVKGQIFQSKQWEAKRDQISRTMTEANKTAMGIINGDSKNVFGYNATYMNYTLEHDAGIDLGFGLYDQSTVDNLLKNNPQTLPRWKINEQKDYIWNKKLVNNAVTQGILQGEGIDKITKRIAESLSMQNENLSRTFARTAMTEAENAGRLQSLEDAEEMGIEVQKQWMATLDGRTRDSHRELDGESVPTDEKFSNGLMYPGDPSGDPREIYNCRCTMVGDVKKYPAKFQRRNQEKDKPIQYMTYKQWEKLKEAGKKGYAASEGGKGKTIDYSKYGGKESFEILKKYGTWDDFLGNAETDEFDTVWENLGSSKNIKEAYANAGNDFKVKTKEPEIPKPSVVETEESKYATTEDYIKACKNNPSVKGMLEIENEQFSGFTVEETRALERYTGSSYRSINGYLRDVGAGMSPEDARVKNYIDNELFKQIGLCHDALEKCELDRDMVFRRGTDLGDLAGLFMQGDFHENKALLENKTVEELNEMFKGKVGVYHGLTSTSSQWNRGFDGEVEALIDAPKGTHAASIMNISRFGTGEGETLFINGTRVICNGVVESDGHMDSSIRVLLSVIQDT